MKDIRILIADDDKEIRNLLKIYLERELYKGVDDYTLEV